MANRLKKYNPAGNSAGEIPGSNPLDVPVDATEAKAHKSVAPQYTAHRTGKPPKFSNKGVRGVSGLPQS